MKIDTKWIFWGAVALVVTGVGLSHIAEGIAKAWPLDTWRVDLDDFITSVALLITSLAAWRKATEAHDEAKKNGNGHHELEKKEENDFLSLEARLKALEERE